MGALRRALLAAALAVAPAPLACDRNVEPFADDAVEEPDLSKIFPEAAGGEAELPPVMPPPGAGLGARGVPGAGAAGAGVAGAGVGNPPAAGVLRGVVRLAPGLEGRAPPGAVLFVIARNAAAGPPTAVLRLPQPRFPLRWEIGPAQRMIQGTPFAGPFALSARLDSDGNATTRGAGDLQGRAPGEHFPGAAGIEIVLGEALSGSAAP
ncbi:MAG: hypothetical protein OXU65_01505 [Deltaproteobacteria bacterium]|nr:hypothetical protein [Deltaproteobacteria bacterium]